MLLDQGQLRDPGLCVLDGGMRSIPLFRHDGQSLFQFFIAADPMLRQEVHGSGGLFQVVQLRPMREPGALLGFDIVLDINEQTDFSILLLRLPGRSGASGDPGGNGFLRVVRTQGFHPGKAFLIRGPAGNVFPSLDLIPFPLQAEQQNSENTGNLVKLGHFTSPQKMLEALEGQIDVTIALAEDASVGTSGNGSATEETTESEGG